MSGMLAQTYLNSGPKGSTVSSSGWYTPFGPETPFASREARLPASILSYRTGPQYSRAIAAGAIPFEGGLPQYYSRLLGDNGHEFQLYKTKFIRSYSQASKTVNYAGFLGVSGKGAISECRPSQVVSAFPSFGIPSWIVTDEQLVTQGTRFIRESNPLAPGADLLVGIAELLREGLPKSLIATLSNSSPKRSAMIRSLGGDYLNYMFGVTPLIKEVDAVWRTLTRIDLIINQWIRDNARVVRRRRRRPRVQTFSDLGANYSGYGTLSGLYYKKSSETGPLDGGGLGNPGVPLVYSRSGSETLETDISFSSAFEYDLGLLLNYEEDSEDYSSSSLAQRFELSLLATGIHPTQFSLYTAWNLTPFSWLVDWFVNFGDILANQRSFQSAGLALTYAYVTAHQIRRVDWESTLVVNPGGSEAKARQSMTYTQKYVRRLRATPFGFGVSFDGLSPFQTSILAALATKAL